MHRDPGLLSERLIVNHARGGGHRSCLHWPSPMKVVRERHDDREERLPQERRHAEEDALPCFSDRW
eukprot:9497649-Pyramimonas_sp.AAC.3